MTAQTIEPPGGSSVARPRSRPELGRLRSLEPRSTVQRYAWEWSGDLLRLDFKSLPRHLGPLTWAGAS